MKFSLDKIWELCSQMWDDIFDLPGDICENKAGWLEENDFEAVLNDCFFCQFAHDEYHKLENHGLMCDFCPGVLVDPKFDCIHIDYNYSTKPREFRLRIRQLDKKRVGR